MHKKSMASDRFRNRHLSHMRCRSEGRGKARAARARANFFFPCQGNQKGKRNGEILRNCSFRRSQSDYCHCDAGFADANSFSLLDAKRTKQEKHARGSVPHDPHARHFGSGQWRCLGLQRAILGAVNLQRSLLKCNLTFAHRKLLRSRSI